MKCNEIRELLPDLAAGITAGESDVHDHLRDCASCGATLADFRKTMALLDEWQAPEPSAYFDTRLQARLREERAKPASGWLLWLRRPALAVSLAVALVAGITFYVERPPRVGPPTAFLPPPSPGTAVSDLQVLDNNHLVSDSDPDSAASLLDDLQVQQDVGANP